jgi:hypothetical protein
MTALTDPELDGFMFWFNQALKLQIGNNIDYRQLRHGLLKMILSTIKDIHYAKYVRNRIVDQEILNFYGY